MLLEPIMIVTASCPRGVGDVMGDFSSRRGRPIVTEWVRRGH